jgi:crossover junction endodeoxyribonuclease RuvC
MRVLGVDPGLTRCGIGVVEGEPGRSLTMIGVGLISTPPGDDIARRLLALEIGIEEWLTEHRPDAVAVERVFSQHNVRTVMGTAQAGAVAIVCAARRGLPVALHTPSEVKAAVTGNGRADKAQVTDMVTRLLRLADSPRPADCADALALAICHLWRGPAQRRMNDAAARASQATSVMAARASAQVKAQLKAQAAVQRAAAAARGTAPARGTTAPGIAAVPGGPR